MQPECDPLSRQKDAVVLGTYESHAFILSLRRRDEFSATHSFGYHRIPHVGERPSTPRPSLWPVCICHVAMLMVCTWRWCFLSRLAFGPTATAATDTLGGLY